jgi:glycosyltransferase involved in cell wall biosynthesis
MPTVSVIVPAHNGARRLPALLAALAAQAADPETYEVIVADDGSTDETASVIARSGTARLVRSAVNGGSYRARNLAIAEARGEILAFTDMDCVPASDWVAAGLAAIDRADLIAGRVEIPLGDRPSAATLLDVARRHIDQEHHVSKYGFGATANLWMRRGVIDRVGRFRDDLVSGGDAEFCHRATAAGLTLAYAPDVLVTHPPRSRAKELFRKQLRLGFGAAQRRGKVPGAPHAHRMWLRPRHYVPRSSIYGSEELERRHYRLTLWEHVHVRVLQYFCCQLPLAMGNLAGTIATGRSRRPPDIPPR